MVKQAIGCMAGAWARLAAQIGEVGATRFLEEVLGQKIPQEAIEGGLLRKARFGHLN